ncbi:hypothetical protein FNV43_RR22573 [Rhamnella rubrinervis]|uniref:Glycosyltransferase n=1 Tax=Rhamnella rubrinervis TaxID=2594499 RepID=A0A8K0DWV7_9ROSA|nr:hypothetical protein FNV43_RR22573 [Rhamnella rubrinervis]
MELEPPIHVFVVCYPSQGNVNPMLRLAKRLAEKGLLVTVSTSEHFGKHMRQANNLTNDQPTLVGKGFVRFEFFEDGIIGDDPKCRNFKFYVPRLEHAGKEFLHKVIEKHKNEGRPISCFVDNPFVPWVCDVADELGIPCATLWIQSCAVFTAYYHYCNGSVPFPSETEPTMDVQLPSLPLLKSDEIPSYLHPSSPHEVARTTIINYFKNLSKTFWVLADTYQELEHDIIEEISKLCKVMPVGPLFKCMKAAPNSSLRGDMMVAADDFIDWLDSKPPASVLYISFGTIAYLMQEQVDEIAHGLLSSGVSFLWVMKPPDVASGHNVHVLADGFLETVGDRGKVVQWSPQEQVLAHPSVGCFLTHCGWNSSVEALTSGVPVMTFPQFGDQVTNAKFLVDVFRVGVRLSRGIAENKVIDANVIKKSLMEVMKGKKAAELKQNALKWKKAAEAAVSEGGSSDRNILEFVEEIRKRSTSTNAQDWKPQPAT